jgi:hypothetical protein
VETKMDGKRIVRRRGGFSDRNGLRPISKTIQITTFDQDTRVLLKNGVFNIIDRHKKTLGLAPLKFEDYFAKKMSTELFCLPIDGEGAQYSKVIRVLSSVFDEGDYCDILDTVEYFANNIEVRDFDKEEHGIFEYMSAPHFYVDLTQEFNDLFKKECVGYRFVEGYITKISDEAEIESLEESANTKYEKVNDHIRNAIRLLSSKTERDYKGCISECCQALECLLNIILDTKGKNFGDALKEYCKNNDRFHRALKESLLKFYGYASDGAGIRHDTNNKDYEEGYDEAKMILVNTSAFINYIMSSNHNRIANEEVKVE